MIAIIFFKIMASMLIFWCIYKLFLERESIHDFKRFYLLGALFLSFLVPFLPTGIFWYDSKEQFPNLLNVIPEVHESVQSSLPLAKSGFEWMYTVYGLYFLVVLVFFMRLIKNLVKISLKWKGNLVSKYGNSKIVLHQEEQMPHSFMNWIFLNKREYESGMVDERLLKHEYAHARGMHSLDIIFSELMICLFWFYPVAYWYKKSIQLNHEFLADRAALRGCNDIKQYQYLLLDTITENRTIYLASNINFLLTKKRLEMMKKESSLRKKIITMFTVVLAGSVVLMSFGKPIDKFLDHNDSELSIPLGFSPNGDGINDVLLVKGDLSQIKTFEWNIYDKFGDLMFNTTNPKEGWNGLMGNDDSQRPKEDIYASILKYETKSGDTKVIKAGVNLIMDGSKKISYFDGEKVIKKNIRDTIPPKPVKSPKKVKIKKSKKPKKSTPMRVIKGVNDQGANIPPPPPPPPASPSVKIVKGVNNHGSNIPPPPPPPPAPSSIKGSNLIAPPPPPPPVTIEDLIKEDATFYLNGELIDQSKAKAICKDKENLSIKVMKRKDGKKNVYIEN